MRLHPTLTTLAVAVVITGATAACQTTTPEPTASTTASTASQTPSATPTTPTPTPTSSTPTPTPDLLNQATQQFTTTQNEVLRLWRRGGLAADEEPSLVLTATTTGAALEDYVAALRTVHDKQVVNVSGEVKVGPAKRLTTAKGALVTFQICTDGSTLVNTIGPSKEPSHGGTTLNTVSYKMSDGQLKMFTKTEKDDETCALA